MRKVASLSGKSLSNVQHHYKNKETLLKGMALYYFNECEVLIEKYQKTKTNLSTRNNIFQFVLYCLSHIDHISDTCLIFREMWAISARDKNIEEELVKYYQRMLQKTASLWGDHSQKKAEKVASLLVPYLDGYSIQHQALPLNQEQIANLLTDMIMQIIK